MQDSLRMLLADATLPTGGFAYSSGLEAAHHQGWVTDGPTLESWIRSIMPSVARYELPFLREACKRSLLREDSGAVHLSVVYDAGFTSRVAREASLSLGRNWLRLCAGSFPDTAARELGRVLRERCLPTHFTPVFAWLGSGLGLEQSILGEILLYQFLRDQVSAAVRIGVVGPMEGSALLASCLSLCADWERTTKAQTHEDAERCAPQWELAQALHETLYSRLFQS